MTAAPVHPGTDLEGGPGRARAPARPPERVHLQPGSDGRRP